MRQLNQGGVKWISRVSETLAPAKALLAEGSERWQHSEDGQVSWFSRQMTLPQGSERWVVIYTQASVERVRQTMQRQVSKAQKKWEQTCWHLSHRHFACEADARATLKRELKGKPRLPVAVGGHRERQLPPGRAGSLAQSVLDCRHQRLGVSGPLRPGPHRHLQRPGRRGAWLSLSQRPPLSGVFGLCQKAGAHYGPQLHHGALPVGVPSG